MILSWIILSYSIFSDCLVLSFLILFQCSPILSYYAICFFISFFLYSILFCIIVFTSSHRVIWSYVFFFRTRLHVEDVNVSFLTRTMIFDDGYDEDDDVNDHNDDDEERDCHNDNDQRPNQGCNIFFWFRCRVQTRIFCEET